MTMSATANRQAITVLGMHRSGTSALAGALGMLGARLPARLVPTTADNPKGFFEPSGLVAIHDRLLASIGSSWFSFTKVDDDWFQSAPADAFADEIAAAVREDYGDAALFVVKDPRLCRLVPLWQKVMAKVGAEGRFALALRPPQEVAQSLYKRDGLPPDYGCALWLRHVLESERQTRGTRRVFVHYHDLLQQPARTAEHVASQLADNWQAIGARSRDLESFIDPAMRHHVAEPEEAPGGAVFHAWVRDAWTAFSALLQDATDTNALRQLDTISAGFDAAVSPLVPLAQASERLIVARAEFQADLGRMAKSPEAAQANLARIIKARDNFKAELGRMTESRDHFRIEHGRSAAQQRALQAELKRMTEARDHFQAELGRMIESRNYFQTELGRTVESRNHYQAELGRMTESRDYFQAELVRLTEAPDPSEAARGRSNGALWPGLRRFLTRLWARDPVR